MPHPHTVTHKSYTQLLPTREAKPRAQRPPVPWQVPIFVTALPCARAVTESSLPSPTRPGGYDLVPDQHRHGHSIIPPKNILSLSQSWRRGDGLGWWSCRRRRGAAHGARPLVLLLGVVAPTPSSRPRNGVRLVRRFRFFFSGSVWVVPRAAPLIRGGSISICSSWACTHARGRGWLAAGFYPCLVGWLVWLICWLGWVKSFGCF
jgi:hypothetical protein